jgi:hypothetical protein
MSSPLQISWAMTEHDTAPSGPPPPAPPVEPEVHFGGAESGIIGGPDSASVSTNTGKALAVGGVSPDVGAVDAIPPDDASMGVGPAASSPPDVAGLAPGATRPPHATIDKAATAKRMARLIALSTQPRSYPLRKNVP